jgi:hypothetical protein
VGTVAQLGETQQLAPARLDEALQLIRARMDAATFDDAWRAGSALTLEDAIEHVFEPDRLQAQSSVSTT